MWKHLTPEMLPESAGLCRAPGLTWLLGTESSPGMEPVHVTAGQRLQGWWAAAGAFSREWCRHACPHCGLCSMFPWGMWGIWQEGAREGVGWPLGLKVLPAHICAPGLHSAHPTAVPGLEPLASRELLISPRWLTLLGLPAAPQALEQGSLREKDKEGKDKWHSCRPCDLWGRSEKGGHQPWQRPQWCLLQVTSDQAFPRIPSRCRFPGNCPP